MLFNARIEQMKLLVLNNEYPPLGGGTGIANLYNLKHFATYSDMQIDLITSHQTRDNFVIENPYANVRLHRLPVGMSNIHNSALKDLLSYTWKAFWHCRKLHKKNHYDICFAYSTVPAGFVAFMLKKTMGLPYIVSLRGSDVPGFDERYKRIYPLLTPGIKYIWKNANRVHSVSEELSQLSLRTAPKQEITVVNNGVDCRQFRPKERKSYVDKRLTILCVGRFVERKGHAGLLQVLAKLDKHTIFPIRLLLIGTGQMKAKIQSLAQDLDISGIVEFTGYVPHDKLPNIYNTSDVFVLLSKIEGMSNALLEALAAGLPIIATDAGGVRQLVHNELNGFLLSKDGSEQELENAFRKILNSSKLREAMSKRSREIAKKYEWSNQSESLLHLIRQTMREQANNDTISAC